jgi:hypothetical protein
MKNLFKIFAVWLAISVCVTSCATKTVIPAVVENTQPSFDGNKQDSGLISISIAGAIVTEGFVARYEALIATYGSEPEFLPPVTARQGISDAPPADQEANRDRGRVYLMTNQALANFIKMNQWKKMGRVPTPKK